MKKTRDFLFSILTFCAATAFYLFFAMYDGVVICADSPSYIDMSITREYFYPALLALVRLLSPARYLMIIVVLQGILAAYCTWSLTMYLCKQFRLNCTVTLLLLLIPCAVSLLNRFAAGRASMYSNSILTEGITISLFLLFFRYLSEYLFTHGKKALWAAAFLSFLLISTRKQMYLSLALLLLVILYVKCKAAIVNKKRKQLLSDTLTAFGICILIFACGFLADHTYNYLLRGEFTGHSSDNRFVMTMVFYTAEREYGDLLPDELQPLYLSIYDRCEEQEYLMHSAGDGWYQEVCHFGDHYDNIQIDTMWPAIQAYADAHINHEDTGRELATDDITHQMITCLLPVTFGKICHVLANNFLSGLVTTIAQRNAILIWYSLIVYLGYLALLFYNIKLHRGLTAASGFCLLTLLSIAGNVLLVSAVIFCQTRYTIYNMPLFYISGLLLLLDYYRYYSSMPRSIKQ